MINSNVSFQSRVEVVVDPLAIQDPRVVKVIRYVADHCNETLTLEQLSKMLKCSSGHLSRLLRLRSDSGFREIHQNIQVSRAVALLEEGLPIKDVYEQCGWRSLSKFYRCFKDHLKMPPRQYQKFCLENRKPGHRMLWGIEWVESVKWKRKTKELGRDLRFGHFR